MSDRLALAHVIEDAGIPRDKAEDIATAIARFVEGSSATKADVDRAEAALRHDVQASEASLRLELAQLEHRLTRNGTAVSWWRSVSSSRPCGFSATADPCPSASAAASASRRASG